MIKWLPCGKILNAIIIFFIGNSYDRILVIEQTLIMLITFIDVKAVVCKGKGTETAVNNCKARTSFQSLNL